MKTILAKELQYDQIIICDNNIKDRVTNVTTTRNNAIMVTLGKHGHRIKFYKPNSVVVIE